MLLCLIRLSFPCIDVYGIQMLPKVFENCSHNLVSTAKYYIAGCKIRCCSSNLLFNIGKAAKCN